MRGIMTKKEAIFKIKNVLDNLDNVCTNKLKAEAVLNELTKIGMVPPKITKLKKDTENFLEYFDHVNEWED
jgi:hypothetical protein